MHKIDQEIFKIVEARITILKPQTVITPFQDATMGPFHTFGIAILTLTDEHGITGEAPVYKTYNNILETCLLPILLHNKNFTYGELYKSLYWSIRNEGYRGQASAMLGQVDLALHDLAAKRNGEPLHRYLGAERCQVPFYGSGGGVNYSMEELETEIGFFMNAGVDCYKMKVGKDFGKRMEEDVERVKFVSNLLGKGVKLAVDANQVWTCEQSLRFLGKVSDIDLAWFEEPIHSASYDQVEKLCNKTPVKISYGESERSGKTFPTLVNIGVKHLQPVPTQISGVSEWMEVKNLAEESNIMFSSGGYSLFTASLMATAGNDCMVEYLYSIMHSLEEYFLVKPQIKNGQFILPCEPGIGAKIDWDYCRRKEKIISTNTWCKKNVHEYRPVVTM